MEGLRTSIGGGQEGMRRINSISLTLRTLAVAAFLRGGVAAGVDYAADICEHTCVKSVPGLCLNNLGHVVTGKPPTEVAQAGDATVFTVRGHVNPHHQVHEIAFPLLYEARHCVTAETDVLFIQDSKPSAFSQMMADAVEEWLFLRKRGRRPPMLGSIVRRDLPLHDDAMQCFRRVRFVLAPMRTPCVDSGSFASDDDAFAVDGYDGTGLGLRVNARTQNDLEPVPHEARAASFDIVREYLQRKHGWMYSYSPDRRHRGWGLPVRLTVMSRGDDVVRRRQTNGNILVRAINQHFGPDLVNATEWRLTKTLDLDKQLKKFYESDVVVAVHGGALGYTFAMRPGSLLVTMCRGVKCDHWESDLGPMVGVTVEKLSFSSLQDEDDLIVNFRIRDVVLLLEQYISFTSLGSASPHAERKHYW